MSNSKTSVIKSWFGIDSILFKKHPKDMLTEEAYGQYLSTKGALLSNLFEIYKRCNYGETKKYSSLPQLVTESYKTAKLAKKNAASKLSEANVAAQVKKEIKEVGKMEKLNESYVSGYVVNKRLNAVALDKFLLEDCLKNVNSEFGTDWANKVLLDAHKTLRDTIVDISIT